MKIVVIFLLSLIQCSLVWAEAAQRRVAVIVDTSGSMSSTDPARYTVLLSQLISDLLDISSDFGIIRLPTSGTCHDNASSNLLLQLDSSRSRFKQRLDSMITYSGSNAFAAPVRTAVDFLGSDPTVNKLLLFLADSGGLECNRELNPLLLQLKKDGSTIAAINLGSTTGAFDSNPAFSFTTTAQNSRQLIQAVAQVYQNFLGFKQVQTGIVDGHIEVEISPYVKDAYFIVAADGSVPEIKIMDQSPGAETIDRNLHGGGFTVGLDRIQREYRIVKLKNPKPGHWFFKIPGNSKTAGWMLLQDSGIALRLVKLPLLIKGVKVPVELELYNVITGKKVCDPTYMKDINIQGDFGERDLYFNDNGVDADKSVSDCIYTGYVKAEEMNDNYGFIHLDSHQLEQTIRFDTEVIEVNWTMTVQSPKQSIVNQQVLLSVKLDADTKISTRSEVVPKKIFVSTGNETIELYDQGENGDFSAGDHIYSGLWVPQQQGSFNLEYQVKERNILPETALINITGSIKFGKPFSIQFETINSNEEASTQLDLSSIEVSGQSEIEIDTDYYASKSVLEVLIDNRWQELNQSPITIPIVQGGNRKWQLRVRAGRCPQAVTADNQFTLKLQAQDENGVKQSLVLPLLVNIIRDNWLVCWAPVLAATALALFAWFIGYGIFSPFNFPKRHGVLLSPEADIEAGFFHPFESIKGSGRGFYRNAKVYLTEEFQFSAVSRGSFVRFRADHHTLYMQGMHGAIIWKQNHSGTWEKISDHKDIRVCKGSLYRNDSATVYFIVKIG